MCLFRSLAPSNRDPKFGGSNDFECSVACGLLKSAPDRCRNALASPMRERGPTKRGRAEFQDQCSSHRGSSCIPQALRADFWEVGVDSNFSVFRDEQFTEWPRSLH